MIFRSRALALFVALLPVASCASIPERSDPTPVRRAAEGDAGSPVSPPPAGLDSLRLVRNFVDSAAAPENNHKAARLHLVPSLRARWEAPSELLVLDNIDTVPGSRPPDTPDKVQVVRLEADKVGRFKADQSFEPEHGPYQVELRVRRGPDGEWRIAEPPPALIASRASFDEQYMPVQVYFVKHDWSGVVADRRYVVSEPTSNLPRRVIDLLMLGPSEGLRSAMDNAIPKGVFPTTNPSEASDGALVVNLSDLKQAPERVRRLIAAQVVLSLQDVSNARVRLEEEGTQMLSNARDLRPSDVQGSKAGNAVDPNLPGLVISDESVHTLDEEAEPIPGPAGSGELDVVHAGQSADGSQLAAVSRTPTGVELRVGPFGEALTQVGLHGADMTPPTWRDNSELWTVVDGRNLFRVAKNEGFWSATRIDIKALAGDQPIKDLRLSHDGTRVAAIVNGEVVVASVRNEAGAVSLRNPVVLSHRQTMRLTDIDWLSNGSLVATTNSNMMPVISISVDGYSWTKYDALNLILPLNALTVTPKDQVVVVDQKYFWQADGPNDLWSFQRALPFSPDSIPFYPG